MKTLFYNCFSGISGDMHMAAMVDLGVPADYLKSELNKLCLADEFTLHVSSGTKMGIAGRRVEVELIRDTQSPASHRHLSDITEIINRAAYPEAVRLRALDIFGLLAKAEAKVHDTTPEKIHFHEVGATDAIVDVVAAALCLEYLDVDLVVCSCVELGGGMVRCEHGLMPVPAPATAELLVGVPCSYGAVKGETTTPTGAAILVHAVDEFVAPNNFTVSKTGYGLGHKDFEIPNVLRVLLGESQLSGALKSEAAAGYLTEAAVQIECNIDDMTPEAFQPLMHGLFELGAMDVTFTAVSMKKDRPAHTVSILCAAPVQEKMVDYLFENSSTIGMRLFAVDKVMLQRESINVETSYGNVRVKLARLKSGRPKWKTEFDDITTLARQNKLEFYQMKQNIDYEVATTLKERFKK